MNTFVKGSVAAGAGIVLLLGGAGTFALWNDSADISDATIESGVLTISAATGTWDNDYDKWVPGDEDTYDTDLTITAVGDTIKGQLEVDEATFGGSTADLADYLDVSYALDLTDPALAAAVVETGANTGVYEFSEGTWVIPVTVTIAFDTAPIGETAQDESVTIEDIGFTIKQVL